MEENIRYLEGIELSLTLAVARLDELLVKRFATNYPAHQMGTGHTGGGLWEIEEGKLLLGVTANGHTMIILELRINN